jgi:formiminoglutamase
LNLEYLDPPQLIVLSETEGRDERRVSNWITEWDFEEEIDVGIIGVPMDTSTMVDSVLTETPNNVRKAFVHFTTFNPDFGVDVQGLKVRYVGDVSIHQTYVDENIRRLEATLPPLFESNSSYVPVVLGGAGAVTWLTATSYAKATGKKLGIVHFDSRSDMRSLDEGGPTDFTPIRAILESGSGIEGKNVAQVGLHGFVGTQAEHQYAIDNGVTVVTAREVRREGIDSAIARALAAASDGTDAVYVTVDGSVLDIPLTYISRTATTGGVSGADMSEAMFILGQEPKVAALDLVDFYTYLDENETTARVAASLLMAFLAGLSQRS